MMHDIELGVTIVSEELMKKNVFYCKENDTHEDRIVLDSDESLLCASCGEQMEQAGWCQGIADQYLDEVDSSEGE